MASNTNRLGLLKKDPALDALHTFNIQTMLNDNWDKIDEKAETIQGAQDKADTAKAAAISAAATDATTKANAAEANAKNASIPKTEKGVANGVSTLDSGGIPVEKTYVVGTYTGNAPSPMGTGVSYEQNINLGFRPKVVIVAHNGSTPFSRDDGELQSWGGVALDGFPQIYADGTVEVITVTSTGFKVNSHVTNVQNSWSYGPRANQNGSVYRYIAFY